MPGPGAAFWKFRCCSARQSRLISVVAYSLNIGQKAVMKPLRTVVSFRLVIYIDGWCTVIRAILGSKWLPSSVQKSPVRVSTITPWLPFVEY